MHTYILTIYIFSSFE